MIFSSPRFFVFLVLLLIALRLVRSLEGRLSLLLFASCLFYAAWAWR